MPKAPPKEAGYRESQDFYAQKWGVSTRAIVDWKGERAPLDDENAMVKWFASRKRLPPGVKTWLRKRRSVKAAVATQAIIAKTEETEAVLDLGITAAWKRLINAEARAEAKFNALDRLLDRAQKEGTSTAEQEIEVDKARRNWLEISRALHALSKSANTENSELLVPKEEVVRILENVGYFMRAGSRTAAKVLVIELAARPGWKIAEVLTTQMWSQFQSAVASLRGDAPGNSLPNWAAEALLKSLSSSARSVMETHAQRSQIMAKLHWALDQGSDLNMALSALGEWPPLHPSAVPPPTADDYVI